MQSFADMLGNSIRYGYDDHYNLAAITGADGRSLHGSYDSKGNLTKWVNRRGRAITFTYDDKNLLTGKTYANGAHISFTYDGHRNLQSVTDASGTISVTYNSADRLTGITYPNGRFLHYSYDAGGRRASIADQSGFTVNYTYDTVGRLSQLADGAGFRIVDYTYDSVGRLARRDMGNGASSTYEYDARSRLARLVNYAPGGAVSSRFEYAYDASGRRTSVTTLEGLWRFAYDSTGQLTAVTLPNGSTVQYTYDAAGNRIAMNSNGAITNYDVNNLNQYTHAGNAALTYDPEGNLISRMTGSGAWTYNYDDENQLIGITGPDGTWTYEYDSLGNRIAQIHNGTRTEDLIDPTGMGKLFARFGADGNLASHYTYGLGLTSAVSGSGSAAYYQFDGASNTVQLTGPAGNVLNSYLYLPFGEKVAGTETVPSPFTYGGQHGVTDDDGNGLYFMRHRWYDPALGRFVRPDPLGIAGDVNLNRYAGNSPVNYSDPSGLEFELDQGDMPKDSLYTGQTPGPSANTPPARDADYIHLAGALPGGGMSIYVNLHNGNVFLSGDVTTPGASLTAGYLQNLPGTAENTDSFLTGESTSASASIGLYQGVVYSGGNWATETGIGTPGKGIGHSWGFPTQSQWLVNTFYYFMKPTHDEAFWREQIEFERWLKEFKKTHVPHSADPNGKITVGFGDQGFIPPGVPISYTIYFENLPAATAPAQRVVVTDSLDNNLDWSTVRLSQIAFNGVTLNVAGGVQSYSGQAMVSTDPNPVSVKASLDPATGILTWRMESLDPVTGGMTADPLAGFLPPNDSSHRGDGFVTFTVRPKPDLANGATITNQASVVFDVNAAITTNTVTNTIESTNPSSTVNSLPAVTQTTSFTVSWSGSDPSGSGIAGYDIFVSTDGGPFTLWLAGATETSATFTGSFGHSYSFYSMAMDNVGHRQITPGPAQSTTLEASTATATTTTALSSSANPADFGVSVTFTATVTASGTPGVNPPSGTVTFQDGTTTLGTGTLNASSVAIYVTASLAAGEHSITAVYAGDPYNSGSTSAAITQTIRSLDLSPPQLQLPASLAVEATGPAGAVVTYLASAVDLIDGPVPVTCLPASGTVFALGITTVNCEASDKSGNKATGSIAVTVQDTTPPSLSLPSAFSVEATSAAGAVVSYAASANDLVAGPVPVNCDHSSGSVLPLGTTTVACSATDEASNNATGSFAVTVRDTTAPSLTLNGAAEMTVVVGSSFIDPGANASDSSGPVAVVTSGVVNTNSIGSYVLTYSATDPSHNTSSRTRTVRVVYAPEGPCLWNAGHQILPPINPSGSSVFLRGLPVPARFRVCDAKGRSISTTGVVTKFRLVGIKSGTTLTPVDKAVQSATSDSTFRFDPLLRDWFFIINTKSLVKGNGYFYRITLQDGSTIDFSYSIK